MLIVHIRKLFVVKGQDLIIHFGWVNVRESVEKVVKPVTAQLKKSSLF